MDGGKLIWGIIRGLALMAGAYYGFVDNYSAATYYIVLAIYAAMEMQDNG